MLLRPLVKTQYRLSKFTTNHYTLFHYFHTATPTFSPNNPPTTAKMPSYIVSMPHSRLTLPTRLLLTCSPCQVTLKDTATDEEIAKTKEDVKAQGGKIGHEYTLIKAFQYDSLRLQNETQELTLSFQPQGHLSRGLCFHP